MRVCVIGAGAAGLTTAKHLSEEGFDVEVFEKKDGLGGLWYFTEKHTGVNRSTTATSSKTFLQFSDYPMGNDIDLFPHHTKYVEYLKNYIREYKVEDSIKYNHEIVSLKKSDKGWDLQIRNEEKTYDDSFDAVAVCSGLHHFPLMPEIEGSENFKGEVMHSSLVKNTEQFKGKRVIVVGGGESAADFVHELSSVADEVYLSLRRGTAVTRHWSPYPGIPADFDSTRAKTWLPRQYLHDYNVSCRLPDRYSPFKTFYTILGIPVFTAMLATSFRKATQTLGNLFKPKTWKALFSPPARHGPACGVELSKACEEICKDVPTTKEEIEEKAVKLKFTFDWFSGTMHNSQPFTKRYSFLEDIVQGKAKIVPGIKKFNGRNEVGFDGDSSVEADAIIFCTGFQSLLPFFKDQKLDGRSLYKNVFLPEEETLGFVGFARPNVGSAPAVAEMQARWLAGVFAGKMKLPKQTAMEKSIEMDAKRYTERRQLYATRLNSLVDYNIYIEDIAREVGCRIKLWKFAFKPGKFSKLLFGPMGSYQYRFHGYGAKPEIAEEALTLVPDLPAERVMQHTVLYFFMKPWFVVLGKLGFKRFRPVF